MIGFTPEWMPCVEQKWFSLAKTEAVKCVCRWNSKGRKILVKINRFIFTCIQLPIG